MCDLEIFIITNGRSTFEYTQKSVENQTVKRPVTVIRDMLWIDALNECKNRSKSKYYLRVDDDMFLHPKAVEYYLHILSSARKCGVYECKLWEDWTNKPAGNLKAYNTRVVKRVGFRPNHLGKVDKNFYIDLKKTKYIRVKDRSMIGLHACPSISDQKKYRKLWRDHNAKISRREFSKTFDNIIHTFNKSVERQYKDIRRLKKINRRYGTSFCKFIG